MTCQELGVENKLAQPRFSTSDLCPVCGHNGGHQWLQAPDRFHGREQRYQLLRCASCSMVWLDDPPQPAEMGRHYGPDYDKYIGDAGESSVLRNQSRRNTVLKYKSTGVILDLGCNTGSFLATFKGKPWDLYGIEISSEAAERAKAVTGAEIFVGDVLDAPFPPESFDAVTSFDVLEHLYQPRQTMALVAKWLKPGGVFVIQIPNIDSGMARVFGSYWYGLELPRHLSHFSPASLGRLAQSALLEEVTVQTHPNPGLEPSVRYIYTEMLKKIGISRPPLATAKPASLSWKIFRGMMRLSVLQLTYSLTKLKGNGETIDAVFQKPNLAIGREHITDANSR
jgi:SAM-dependent methyltransferase